MSDAVETIELEEGIKIKLYYDEDASNPRKEFDNLSTMLCAHDRYDLGDEKIRGEDQAIIRISEEDGVTVKCSQCGATLENDGDSWFVWIKDDEGDDVEQYECEKGEPTVHRSGEVEPGWHDPELIGVEILNLYLYDHSGITMRTSRFSDPWDSGQVGVIFLTHETVRKEWRESSGELTDEQVVEKALACLEAEVETYDQYLTGDIYGFVVVDSEGETLDSCWGFYGMKVAEEDAKSTAEYYVDQARKERDEITDRLVEIARIDSV